MGNEATKEAAKGSASIPDLQFPALKCMGNNLNNFRKENLFCDVMLIVEQRIFRAHRNILAASSPFFKTMFTSNFAEAHQRKVALEEVSPELMTPIIEFIYTGHIEINEDIIKELLHDAHQLQVTTLIEICFVYLSKNIAVDNCITTYGLSQKYSNNDLKHQAHSFILMNFPAVIKTRHFLDMPSDDDLIGIIKEDTLNVVSEDIVCDAVFRWLHHDDNTDRKRLFAGVLEYVRLTFVSTTLLRKIDEEEEIIKSSNHCSNLVKQALFNKLLTKGKKEKPRKFYESKKK